MYRNIEEILKQKNWLSSLDKSNFEEVAFAIFHYQYENNQIYHDFTNAIGRLPNTVKELKDIPFLPIHFFKTHRVTSKNFKPELIFESSGTTGTLNSKHYVRYAEIYEESFLLNFKEFYGDPREYVFLCLLPSYLERGNSSLVYMAEYLIKESKHSESDFYLHDFQRLAQQLKDLKNSGKKVLLLGVTFALLDFADAFPMDLSHVLVMETGGMKGRREEWSRNRVHDYLKEKWNLPAIHSEYGMTELLSQGYSHQNGIFRMSQPLKAFVREQNDPFEVNTAGNGCLNIIDLANVHSCSFIATDDLVRIHPNQDVEILGRLDHSALRGCSLMVV